MQNTKHEHKDVHQGEGLVTYWSIYILLMVLLVITVVVADHDLGGSTNVIVAMIIAVIKALLVILFFMHVRHGTKLIWIVVAAGFFWLAIFMVMSFADYGGPNNGYRTAGNQAGIAYPVSQTPRPDQHFFNPLSPMLP